MKSGKLKNWTVGIDKENMRAWYHDKLGSTILVVSEGEDGDWSYALTDTGQAYLRHTIGRRDTMDEALEAANKWADAHPWPPYEKLYPNHTPEVFRNNDRKWFDEMGDEFDIKDSLHHARLLTKGVNKAATGRSERGYALLATVDHTNRGRGSGATGGKLSFPASRYVLVNDQIIREDGEDIQSDPALGPRFEVEETESISDEEFIRDMMEAGR